MSKVLFRLSKPIRFLISGGLAALIEYSVFFLIILLPSVAGIIVWAQVISYICGFIVSFYLQRNWVYRSNGSTKDELIKYTLLAAINSVLGVVVLWILVNPLSIIPLIAKLLVMIMVAAWNYVIFQKLIFTMTASTNDNDKRSRQ